MFVEIFLYIYIKVYTYYCLNICISIKKNVPMLKWLIDCHLVVTFNEDDFPFRSIDAGGWITSWRRASFLGCGQGPAIADECGHRWATLFSVGNRFLGGFVEGEDLLQVCKSFFFNLFLDTGRLPSIDNYSLFVLFTCLFVHHILHRYFATCHPTKIF